jgi:crotonobetainyl-CoA hydratase
MVLGCVIVVAAEHAQFGLPEPRIGFLPLDGGMVQLPRQIGMRAAMGMLLTGRRVKAPEALTLGLVNEVVAADQLDAAVQRWLDDMLACSPLALQAIKQNVKTTIHMPVGEALNMRLPALIKAMTCDDREEGVRAFQEKRAPRWQGR